MSIFDKIKDKLDDIYYDTLFKFDDKFEDSLDLMDRRMQRRFVKFAKKEDPFNALLGLEKFKDASIKDRAKVVFAQQKSVKKTFAEYGDIIGVDRGGIYQHYAIYIGNNRVIHYAGNKDDFDTNSKNITIHEDDMGRFLGNNTEYFVFDCEAKENKSIFGKNLLVAYSPEETVQRAKSKLGENRYSLPFNNCEHFAIWCKTGIHQSTQVDKVLQTLAPIIIKVP